MYRSWLCLWGLSGEIRGRLGHRLALPLGPSPEIPTTEWLQRIEKGGDNGRTKLSDSADLGSSLSSNKLLPTETQRLPSLTVREPFLYSAR